MRKSKENLFQLIYMALLAIYILLSWTVFKTETNTLRTFYLERIAFTFMTSIFLGGAILFCMIYLYEKGRTKGIKNMANELCVNPEDYYDDTESERIPVTEKQGDKRKSLRYDNED